MKRIFAFVFALALAFVLPVCAAAASYDEHTQNDGMWHVEDSKGGAASSVIIRGSGSGESSLLADTQIKVIGKNEFDGDSVFNLYFHSGSPEIKVLTQGRMVYCCCLPNQTYTISKTAGLRFAVGYVSQKPKVGLTVRGIIHNFSGSQVTITTDSEAEYLVAWVYNADWDTTITAEKMLSSVQIEKGSSATTYEIYVNPSNLILPTNLEFGDSWDVLSGAVTRKDGSVEFFEPQSLKLPVGFVNIFSTGAVQPSEISITYNYDPLGSGGSGGSGVVSSTGGSGGLNDFTRVMSNVLGLYKIDLTIYGYTFSLWQVFIFSMLIGIVVNFIADLIFG